MGKLLDGTRIPASLFSFPKGICHKYTSAWCNPWGNYNKILTSRNQTHGLVVLQAGTLWCSLGWKMAVFGDVLDNCPFESDDFVRYLQIIQRLWFTSVSCHGRLILVGKWREKIQRWGRSMSRRRYLKTISACLVDYYCLKYSSMCLQNIDVQLPIFRGP